MDLIAPTSNSEEESILEAAQDGQAGLVKSQLEGNPSLIWARKLGSGETLLHLALANGHEELVRVLLQKGANPEVANHSGWKPLAIAAKGGPTLLPGAELLLQYGANVDAVNVQLKQSALHLCASGGFSDLAQILLHSGAKVDLRDVNGETPLFKAVAERRTDMVKLLLKYGAARNVRSSHGVTLESLASDNADILRLLRSAQVLRGPRVSKQLRRATTRTQTLVARNPAPLDDQNKMVACRAFQATIVDFYVGESEERIEKTVPVYDVLYGQGAEGIMRDARAGEKEGLPSFRWYHLPANNMEWVETLVRRHFSERTPRTGQYTEALAADLGMRRTQNEHHLMFTSKGSFIRPFCRKVRAMKSGPEETSTRVGRYIGAFLPYLHFEIQRDFKVMSKAVDMAIEEWASHSLPVRNRVPNNDGGERRSGSGGSENHSGRSHSVDEHGEANTDQGTVLSPGMLHKILIQGYLKPGASGEVPPLQIRRTLDHYFYSHLASTSRRDHDQVIQRYTAEFIDVDPKMFMVDQLWLWVLDDDTVISCCPMRWDSWAAGQTNPVSNNHSGPDGPRTWNDFVVRENDPLNIHQCITQYLTRVRRESITNVEDLCRLIASTCINAFDHYEIPDEFHFFDFVEHTIGQVMDKTAERFQEFRVLLDASASSNELLSAMSIRIELETKLLGEAEDIRDELSIMKLVLQDQQVVAEQLDSLLGNSGPLDDVDTTTAGGKGYALKGNVVLKNHLARIERMETLTKRSIQSIRSLLKLKQQHANLSEAHSARRQAEYTSRQTHVAASYNKKVADQLDLARRQAEETARQGNVIMLFTVVTVTFLPLSFMTSFFTIELDGFPYNNDGKMPLPTVVAIILSVSAGVSIPFVLIAFNLEAVNRWTSLIIAWAKRERFAMFVTALIILILVIALAIILSQPLESGIKAGVGIGLGLLAAIAIASLFISHWVRS